MKTSLELRKVTLAGHYVRPEKGGNYFSKRSWIKREDDESQNHYFYFATNEPLSVAANRAKLLVVFTLLLTLLFLCSSIYAHSRKEVVEGASKKTGLVATPIPIPADLLSRWSGEGNANDLEGSNNGKMHNGASFGGGKIGQAFKFDGNGYVQAPTANLPTGNNDRTLMMWVKINSFYTGETFFAGYGAFGEFEAIYGMGTSASRLFFSQWGEAVLGPQLDRNKWYHIACSNIGNEVTLYLDGKVVASGTLPIYTPAGGKFYLGRVPGELGDIRKLNGLVDEVQIYNRALDASEIQGILNTATVNLTTADKKVEYTGPANIKLIATIPDKNKIIKKVSFYNGSTLLHTKKVAPYDFTWRNVRVGNYSLTAVVTDDEGLTTTSAPLKVKVVKNPILENDFSFIGSFNGHDYYKSKASFLWEEANNMAVSLGGHLATISSQEENEFIYANGLDLSYVVEDGVYIGLNDEAQEGTFVWSNGEPVGYKNWYGGGPDNAYGLEDHVEMVPWDGTWNDMTNYTPLPFILEFDSGTPTVSLTTADNKVKYFAPANIKLIATFSNNNKTINKVSFYNGSTLLHTKTVAPYDFTWRNVRVGNYSLTAVVTDDEGLTTTSAPLKVKVVKNPILETGFSFIGSFNGHEYYKSNAAYLWTEADILAGSLGGHLATISSKEENEFIYENGLDFSNDPYQGAYIGLNDEAREGTFQWSNRQPVNYTNWAGGEPNNGLGGEEEDHVEMLPWNGTWNDMYNSTTLQFILEFDFKTMPLDMRYGGTGKDNLTTVIKTPDGGYLTGGYTNSGLSGDKSQNSQGKNDYWIVKSDKKGQKQWDKRYGGSSDDYLNSIILTADGSYLLAGSSASGMNGHKTQGSQGERDYWVVKIDEYGNKLWDKRYGGIGTEELKQVIQMPSGSFILAGTSNSPLSGDISQPSYGNQDYWVIKINRSGKKIWDQRYGGSLNEYLEGLTLTQDGGFLLGGSSASGVSGTKTQVSQGGSDYWVVRITGEGTMVWDKTYGGNGEDQLMALGSTNTSSGNFFLAGTSNSTKSWSKSQNSQGGKDYWLLKINPNGRKIFDKRFGGSQDEELRTIHMTPEGGYLLGGSSSSEGSGDKSQASQGASDYWIVKTTANGVKEWDHRFGGTGKEELRSVLLNQDGGYLLAGRSDSGVSGDRTQPSQGSTDYWLVKVAPVPSSIIAIREVSEIEEPETIAGQVSLNAYPNPLQDQATVSFTLPETQTATLKVYDLQGREVTTLFQGVAKANQTYQVEWQATKQQSGLYLLQLQTPAGQQTQKLLLSK